MSTSKIAVVTGGNKGIGYAIVKGLCEKFQGTVYLTARNEERGKEAVNALKALGFNPSFHQLNVTDEKSIETFRDYLKVTYGGLDLLINNAAIAFNVNATESTLVQAEQSLATNYFGLVKVCTGLFPLLKQNAVVVNISSSAGHLAKIPSADLRNRFSSSTLTVELLNDLENEFISAIKDGNYEKTWGNSTYVVSKVGVSALTRVQQRLFDNEQPNRHISINCVHPGYVNTDMTNHKGPLSVEEGASAPLFLALEPHGLKGQYVWNDKSVVDWLAPTIQVIQPKN